MTQARFYPSALALALAACNVTEVPLPPSTLAINQCDGNEDCAGGACSDGACVAGTTELKTVMVEVTPPPGSVLPTLPYFTALTEGMTNIVLQPPAKVSGYVTLHPDAGRPRFQGNLPTDEILPFEGTIPVQATFTPSARADGLPSRTYRSEPIVSTQGDPRHGFEVVVPPGEYDVYIEPRTTTAESPVQVPPVLLLKQHIATSGPFDVKLSKPSSVVVPVRWATGSLDKFVVELTDSVSGRVLSAPALLQNPGTDIDGHAFYLAPVTYSEVLEKNAMNELVVSPASYGLVRIVPPPETVAPTILGDVRAIGLTQTNDGGILQDTPLPAPVTVVAQTTQLGTTRLVPAAVTVTATRIEGLEQGLYASFVRTYQVVDKDIEATETTPFIEAGTFRATLPPGDYIVDSIPKIASTTCTKEGCSPLAARRDLWQVGVSPDVQSGKLIQFQRAPSVSGSVTSPVGAPLSGAAVRAKASFVPPPDMWNSIEREGRPSPLATTGIVDDRGSFELSADPGTFDLFVQPDPGTRFGWLVWPRFKVGARDEDASTGPLTAPLSRRYSGKVLVSSKDRPVVPNALIRAYVYITPEGEYSATEPPGGSVLQVAETRANLSGDFELLIPASLNSPPPTTD